MTQCSFQNTPIGTFVHSLLPVSGFPRCELEYFIHMKIKSLINYISNKYIMCFLFLSRRISANFFYSADDKLSSTETVVLRQPCWFLSLKVLCTVYWSNHASFAARMSPKVLQAMVTRPSHLKLDL